MSKLLFTFSLSYVMLLSFVNKTYALNDALLTPIANNDSAVAVQNNPVTISPLANDVLNGTLQSVTIKSQPANGVVTLSGNDFIYTPTGGFNGTNTFTYSFTTTGGISNTATETVLVLTLFPQQVANNDFATTSKNTPVTIDVLANDFLRDAVDNIQIVTQPANGTVTYSLSGQAFIYTPNTGFTGTNTFTYYFVNPAVYSAASTIGTVTVNVTPLPAVVPVANNDVFSTPQNTPITISSLANDIIIGTVQSVTLKSQPANGSVVLSGNNFIYTPNASFFGINTFTYCFTTTSGTSNTASVTVNVAAAYPSPVANNDAISSPKNSAATISPLTNDAINGVFITLVTLKSQPANGTATVNGNDIIYTPNVNFVGTNTFTYSFIVDGRTSNTATVTVTVTNATPVSVANDDLATTSQNTPVTISVLNNDVIKGIFQSLSIVSQPANGRATVSGNNIIYTPNTGFIGNNTFIYLIITSNGNSNAATVNVTVTRSSPVANNDAVSTVLNKSVTFNPLANDVINGTLGSASISSQPTHGTANFSGRNFNIIYTPNRGFTGTDIFTYNFRTSDFRFSNTATVTVTVRASGTALAVSSQNNSPLLSAKTEVENILNDGSIVHLDIKKVDFAASIQGILIYPNPSNQFFDVNLKDFAGKDVELRLYNQIGLELFVHKIENVTSSTFDHIEVNQYTNGQYFIRVSAKGVRDVIKAVVILK